MQKIHVELTDLDPGCRDRLIDQLRSWLAAESADIHLEVRDTSADSVVLPAGGGQHLRIPAGQIWYVTSDGHYCLIRLRGGSRRFRIRFSDLAAMLPGEEFLNCSRGVMVGMAHIRQARNGCFVMEDGAVFPVRRSGRRELLLRYEQYRIHHQNQ